jgi:hypothetical protein
MDKIAHFIKYKSVHYSAAKAKDNCGQYLEFQKDMGFFKHPGWRNVATRTEHTECCAQAMEKRVELVLVHVSQWIFPNTATFKGNILTCQDDDITGSMEKWSSLVLTLFHPFWSESDLCVAGQSHGYV